MRRLLGVMLLIGGLGLAVQWMPGQSSERQLAVVTEIAGQGIAKVSLPDAGRAAQAARTFSPPQPLGPGLAPAPTSSSIVETAAAAQGLAARPVPEPVPALRPAGRSTHAGGASSSDEVLAGAAVAPPEPRLASPHPTEENSRFELVRSLQRELKRVGCYSGEVDGDWGPGSKRAMDVFMDRVNAALSNQDPDYILLSLVQSRKGPVCGKGCPSRQVMSEDGRCVPRAVLAQAARKAQGPVAGDQRQKQPDRPWATTVVQAEQGLPTSGSAPFPAAGRMAVGAPLAPDLEDGAGPSFGGGPSLSRGPMAGERRLWAGTADPREPPRSAGATRRPPDYYFYPPFSFGAPAKARPAPLRKKSWAQTFWDNQ